MSTKHTLTLLILAVVLGIAAYWYSQREEKMLESAAPSVQPVFSGITSATVERVEISVPEAKPVTLTKLDGVWYTNVEKKHKADSNLISNLFATLEKEVTGEVVSDNPEHYADYQVNDTSATRVKVLGREGKVLLDLYVGKAGSTFFTTFVRKAGEKEVLSANASLTYVFNKPEGWREKRIFQFDQEDIVEVSGEFTSGSLLLKKEAGLWKVHQPVVCDAVPTKINPFLSSIANLRTTSYVDVDSSHTLADYGLDPARQKLVVTYEDKSTSPPKRQVATLLLSEPKVENGVNYYYARRADSEDVFKLTEYQAKMLTPDPRDFAVSSTSSASGTTSAAAEETSAPATHHEAQQTTVSFEETTSAPAHAAEETSGSM
jgi:(2Fe-2S) ferredoxin